MADTVAQPIYQLKVTLLGAKPPIWRRLHVPSSINLKKFHQILQIALGWTDSHLHKFEVGGQTYGIPHSEYPNTTRNEARVWLNEVLLKEKDAMIYEYDFGDGWEHKVVLEKIIPSTPDLSGARCIAGARACPPDDCGGVGGYEEFLEAIGDPFHPEVWYTRDELARDSEVLHPSVGVCLINPASLRRTFCVLPWEICPAALGSRVREKLAEGRAIFPDRGAEVCRWHSRRRTGEASEALRSRKVEPTDMPQPQRLEPKA